MLSPTSRVLADNGVEYGLDGRGHCACDVHEGLSRQRRDGPRQLCDRDVERDGGCVGLPGLHRHGERRQLQHELANRRSLDIVGPHEPSRRDVLLAGPGQRQRLMGAGRQRRAWSFTVGGTTQPPVFGKLTPANGTAGLGSSVTLTWSAMTDAGYWVCWDTTNNNTCDGTWWPNGGGAARALTGLAAGTYYWQVRGQNASGTYRCRQRDMVVVHGRRAGAAGGIRKDDAGQRHVGPRQCADTDVGRFDWRDRVPGVRRYDERQHLQHDLAIGRHGDDHRAERPRERSVLLAGAGAEREWHDGRQCRNLVVVPGRADAADVHQADAGKRRVRSGQCGNAHVVGVDGRGLLGVLGHDEQQHV